jgi:hypothetical protein
VASTTCGGRLTLPVEVQFLQRGVSVETEDWIPRPLGPSRIEGAESSRA